ncbi:MAG TPA: FxsB family cyclophane-forming radical SAM/SPASM peptide maturase [Trebonia sp.]|nr:FxsB family cyclophane-forming radical SAM/SPASM peptide maturase [Trebonia sp.]
MAEGWSPVPFQEFVVKIHSRCDLACDYCYMYEKADQSWRDRPRRMSAKTAQDAAMRIGEHARTHRISRIALIMHGGEPLLAGPELISELVRSTRAAAGPLVRVDARVQTNGVGLNDSYLELFRELDVQLGVSLDGAMEAHDRHRRFPSGRGSYAAVAAGLDKLARPSYRHLFNGLLCTIDLRNDPIATYKALAEFEPPRIDFLLPHGTWSNPPPGRMPGAVDAAYADWLITIFDRWYPAPQTRIRLFEDIMDLLLGSSSSSDMLGLSPSRVVFIETDGAIELADNLKVAYHGAAATGLHVSSASLDEALLLPGVVARQLGARALSPQCRACPIHQVCGGGLYAHRYRPGTGFYNPSVYCPDLIKLIGHVRDVMQADIDDSRAAG